MRKISIISIIIAAAFVSCSKEVALPDNTTSASSFIATLPKDDTKTSLDGLNVLWSEGDQVDVVYDKASFATSHATFTLDGDGGTKIGRFTGGVDLSGKDLFVVYPKATGYADGVETIVIPTNPNYGESVIPMYGLGNTNDGVSFHHLCSVIHLPVYTDKPEGLTISTAALENESGEKICGRFFFQHSSSAYSTSLGVNSSGNYKSLNINCNSLSISADAANPTDLYFVVRGGIPFKPKFTLCFSDGSSFVITKSSAMTLEAGKKISFPTVKVVGTNDKMMKIGNGEWQEFDLSSVSTIPGSIAFKSEQSIFTGEEIDSILNLIKSQESAVSLDMSAAVVFSGFSFPKLTSEYTLKLTSIKLPEGVQTISNTQFTIRADSPLTDIYLPTTLQSIGGSSIKPSWNAASPMSFHSSIKYHVDNAYLTDIDGVVFNNAKTTLVAFPAANTVDYTNYSVPSGVKSIKSEAFTYAHYLKTLTVPASVTTIPKSAFLDNYLLENIVFEGHDAPALTGSGTWETKPERAPGYNVATGKKLTIPLADDVASYNAAGWAAFTGIGYAYYY